MLRLIYHLGQSGAERLMIGEIEGAKGDERSGGVEVTR